MHSNLANIKRNAIKKMMLNVPIKSLDNLKTVVEIGTGVSNGEDNAISVDDFTLVIAKKEGENEYKIGEVAMFKILRKYNLIIKNDRMPTDYALLNKYITLSDGGRPLITTKGRNAYWSIVVTEIAKLKKIDTIS